MLYRIETLITRILTDDTDINSQRLISADEFSQSEKINPF